MATADIQLSSARQRVAAAVSQFPVLWLDDGNHRFDRVCLRCAESGNVDILHGTGFTSGLCVPADRVDDTWSDNGSVFNDFIQSLL